MAMKVALDVLEERKRQDAKWGEQNHPSGTGGEGLGVDAARARARCDKAAKEGKVTWLHILDEEVREAFAEKNPEALRAELVQVAAVAVAWVEYLDRERKAGR